MLRRQKHALSQSTAPPACTLLATVSATVRHCSCYTRCSATPFYDIDMANLRCYPPPKRTEAAATVPFLRPFQGCSATVVRHCENTRPQMLHKCSATHVVRHPCFLAFEPPFFCASFFPFFFALSTPPFPGQFSSPKSPLSGISDLLFLVEKRHDPAGVGFWGGFWTGSPPQEKKENPLFLWGAKKGEQTARESEIFLFGHDPVAGLHRRSERLIRPEPEEHLLGWILEYL